MLDLQQRLADFPQSQIEIIRRFLNQFNCDLRCAAPGIITAFDPITQTATVQLCLKELIRIQKKSSVYQDTKQIPELLDVPVVMPRAGNFIITVPITEGDECLVVFADACIDSWWQNGCSKNNEGQWQAQEPMSLRRHDLSDAFAILGTWSQPQKIDEYAIDALEIRTLNGNNKIQIKDDAIKIVINDDTYIEIKNGELSVKSSATVNIEGTIVNVKGDSVVIAEGAQGIARLGDTVSVDPSTHTGTITSASAKVKAG